MGRIFSTLFGSVFIVIASVTVIVASPLLLGWLLWNAMDRVEQIGDVEEYRLQQDTSG